MAASAGRCLLLLLGLVLLHGTNCFYVPGVAPMNFRQGDPVDIKAVKLTSSRTQLPYEYYSLPFCKPVNITYKAENLDASTFGLGAVLSQEGADGKEHPVAYISRKLLPREVGYAAIERECLAVVWALKKLQPYLYGQHFTVVTDHNPLVWLHRVSWDNGRLLRWSLALQPFYFSVVYRPGRQNGNADGLSRQTTLEP